MYYLSIAVLVSVQAWVIRYFYVSVLCIYTEKIDYNITKSSRITKTLNNLVWPKIQPKVFYTVFKMILMT